MAADHEENTKIPVKNTRTAACRETHSVSYHSFYSVRPYVQVRRGIIRYVMQLSHGTRSIPTLFPPTTSHLSGLSAQDIRVSCIENSHGGASEQFTAGGS
jgi:hypothetical protein